MRGQGLLRKRFQAFHCVVPNFFLQAPGEAAPKLLAKLADIEPFSDNH